MFRITSKWLNDNKTESGGWTKAQIEVLGLKWPPKKRWIGRINNKLITEETKEKFEQYKYKLSEKAQERYRQKMINKDTW